MMTAKYCPRNEIKKLEMELWELKVKGTDLASYTQHFQELALMYGRMFLEESDKIEKYIDGLPDMIHGSTENKRKFEDSSRNNQNQQQKDKRRNTGRAYAARPSEKREYGRSLPKCSNKSQPLISFELLWRQSQPSKCFWEWRGIANMAFIQLGGVSRVDEMILARERSGLREKYGTIVQVVTGFWGGKEDFLGE
ncbi:reverse transcriptase domain-containing protein [Tanacetum coccineum]